ncbi:IS1096 element passenger TnpR family protein [Candidatus Laterigemmans baculatus]|uniref:IS1096 element passenger TnpR family protein n=1 Tax=Candidatus Laterigemmans baculatus TaxID=2770505 RepID=UPI0013D9CD98|nr:MarR family transcriptional regulator [Candidatus Laterigemmans baculatus]
MPDFTPTQGRYLSYIHAYTSGFGTPPAESEIAEAMGVSPPSVHQMMKTLEKKNLIRRTPREARSIEILVDRSDIPPWTGGPWTGGPITRTVTQWVMRRPRSSKRTVSASAQSVQKQLQKIYVFKITLVRSKPLVWRRIETRDVTLGNLHEQIQTAMGWTNSHMHQFEIGGQRYTDPRFLDDEFGDFGARDYSDITISKLVDRYGSKLTMHYEYDFGDGWEHKVVLEKTTEAEAKTKYPRCTAGKCACPPEDVGGVYGYADFLLVISDPEHPDHEDLMEWGGPFDPKHFDHHEATRAMQLGLPAW